MYERFCGHQLFVETQITRVSVRAVQQEQSLGLTVHPETFVTLGMGPIVGETWSWKKRSCKPAAESSLLHYAAVANQGFRRNLRQSASVGVPHTICFSFFLCLNHFRLLVRKQTCKTYSNQSPTTKSR